MKYKLKYTQYQAAEQQLLLAPPATAQYYDSREKATTEVERTIGDTPGCSYIHDLT